MGILREEDKKKIRVEDVTPITYADYIFDDSSDDEDLVIVRLENSEEEGEQPAANVHQLNYERRMSRRNAKFNAQKAIRQANNRVGGGLDLNIKKNMGAQKMRRIEHARVLAQFCDAHDIRYDCSDLIEETVSAFTRLLRNEENFRNWVEFTEKSDDEQERILRELDQHFVDNCFESTSFAADEADRKRATGCSAKTSFMRLDQKFKTALSKKNGVRLELIEKLENEFRKFFNNNPTGIWSDSVASTQKRFYLHAVAQFLMLQSRSQQNATQGTVTEVYNSRKKFEPPSESLHSFLHKKLNKGA